MKTRIIITAAFIILGTIAQAAAPKRTLTVYTTLGKALSMPVVVEEAVETLPFAVEEVTNNRRHNQTTVAFDVSALSKPEAEVNDVPCELRHLIK
jgi:hypothetical protein